MRNEGNVSIIKQRSNLSMQQYFSSKTAKVLTLQQMGKGLTSNRHSDSSNKNRILLFIMFPRNDVQNNVIWKYFEVTLPQLC